MDPKQLIAQMAEKKLGPGPQGAPQGAPPQAPQGAPPQAGPGGPPPGGPGGMPPGGMPPGGPAAEPPKPKADPSPTDMEKATKAADPNNAGDEAPIQMFDIPDGETTRQMTADQINGSMRRYRDLNHKWASEVAPNKAVLDMANRIMGAAKKAGHDVKGEDVAHLMETAIAAFTKNPQMGGNKTGKQPQQKPGEGGEPAQAPMSDTEAQWKKWEQDNAVSLPPGFRESQQSQQSMQQQMQAMMKQMQAMQQQGGQGAQAAQQAQAGAADQLRVAQASQAEAAQGMIRNNLQQAMAAVQVPPDAIDDVMTFAMQRGYTPEDFIDAGLTQTVMKDYQANKDAPEVNRLREIAKRRQAFTGSAGASPGGGASAAPDGGGTLAALTERAMQQKNMM